MQGSWMEYDVVGQKNVNAKKKARKGGGKAAR